MKVVKMDIFVITQSFFMENKVRRCA